ncbi:PPM-type phosphatase domain protein [Raphanus sativus]|nr:PPM-type phosphatase domain protein [Raphanus sativus]
MSEQNQNEKPSSDLDNYTVGAGGSSFNGLSLTDFLDKFMEKKPTQNTWHSGSQIKRSKEDCYLNGVLIFTRTIGGCELETAYSFHCLLFTSDFRPEIQHIILTNDVEFLILACDGTWDVFSSQNSVSNVKQELSRPQGRIFTRVAQYKPLMFTKALLFIKKLQKELHLM